jgi:hypothetical protein
MFIALCALGAFAFDGSLKSHSASSLSSSAKAKWLDDMRAAHDLAKHQGKDILLRIVRPLPQAQSATGPAVSATAVLDSEAFVQPASTLFVLLQMTVEPDTRSTGADQTAKTQNVSRTSQSNVAEFFLFDPDGNGYARSNIVSNDASAYRREFERLHHLRICREWERERLLTTTGVKRIRHLTGLIAAVGSLVETGYPDLRQRANEQPARKDPRVQFKIKPGRIVLPDNRDRAVKLSQHAARREVAGINGRPGGSQ